MLQEKERSALSGSGFARWCLMAHQGTHCQGMRGGYNSYITVHVHVEQPAQKLIDPHGSAECDAAPFGLE